MATLISMWETARNPGEPESILLQLTRFGKAAQ